MLMQVVVIVGRYCERADVVKRRRGPSGVFEGVEEETGELSGVRLRAARWLSVSLRASARARANAPRALTARVNPDQDRSFASLDSMTVWTARQGSCQSEHPVHAHIPRTGRAMWDAPLPGWHGRLRSRREWLRGGGASLSRWLLGGPG